MGGRKRNGVVLSLVAAGLATVLGVGMFLGLAGIAGALERLPHRSASTRPQDCVGNPRPNAVAGQLFPGQGSFHAVGGIDASGCDSWPYELAASFGVTPDFFAGPQFRAGVTAFEYGTKETTELIDGDQLIAVKNPTRLWQSAYVGTDVCTRRSPTSETCLAPALLRRPDDVPLLIVLYVLLGLAVLLVLHTARPAGPILRHRLFRKHQSALAIVAGGATVPVLTQTQAKELRRRMRRLERAISAELSESQHRWFQGHLSAGRHATALEAVARWFAESKFPVPDHVRQEFEWLSAALGIEGVVLPILDGRGPAEEAEPSGEAVAQGFDVPVDEFKRLVAEAVDRLPDEFGRAMHNVVITVDEEAEGRDRYGQYQGVPLTRRRYWQWYVHPDHITIYRRPICAHSRSEEEVRARVYATVIHEIAHHFGISNRRLDELGW
jgi:predicted Zn-dependent protease with MMP-like domain